MRCKIVIQTRDKVTGYRITSPVWSGEIDIKDQSEYLAKISIIGEGDDSQPQPICDIPFALGIGYYMWVPPESAMEKTNDSYSLT